MATLFLSVAIITSATAQFATTETDDPFAAFSGELEPMDWIWIVYAVIALSLSLCCIVPKIGLCNAWCQEEKYDALSKQCYDQILIARGYNAEQTAVGDRRPLSLLVLRQDLKEKQIWHHDWKRDFVVFLRNEHALFSTCYSHPDHPFSRRDRRCILLSVILLDFGVAMAITYGFTQIKLSEGVTFTVDFLISYIFGAIMSILESILVSFAVCAAVEKCPSCIRDLCKCCGTMVITSVLCWAVVGFTVAIIIIILIAKEDNSSAFWEVFALNFFVGLIQAWFLIDLIIMILQFRSSWKEAHPPPPGAEREELEKKKKSTAYRCLKCSFVVCCCPLWMLWQCCCSKGKKSDPYDDGQDDFGVNYKEYLKWKNGEEIVDRDLPQSYHAISTAGIERKLQKAVDQRVDAVNQKVDTAKQGVVKTYDANVAGLQKSQDDLKKKGKMFGNKWKAKAMGMQMKLGKKTGDDQKNINSEDVELVVGDK